MQSCKRSLSPCKICPTLIFSAITALSITSLASNSLIRSSRSCALAGVGVCEWLAYRGSLAWTRLNLVLRALSPTPARDQHQRLVVVQRLTTNSFARTLHPRCTLGCATAPKIATLTITGIGPRDLWFDLSVHSHLLTWALGHSGEKGQ